MHDNYIGKVVYVIPQLGLVTRAISPPVNYILIAVILVILFVLMKKGKEKNKSLGMKYHNNMDIKIEKNSRFF